MYNASWAWANEGDDYHVNQLARNRAFWQQLELDRWFGDFECQVKLLLKDTLKHSQVAPNDIANVERDVAFELSRLFRDIKAKYIQ